DEATINRADHPGAYILAAVITSPQSLEPIRIAVEATQRDWRRYADDPTEAITRYRFAHLNTIRQHADKVIVALHSPIAAPPETSRLTCLRRILTALNQHEVSDAVLDNLGNIQTWTPGEHPTKAIPIAHQRDRQLRQQLIDA